MHTSLDPSADISSAVKAVIDHYLAGHRTRSLATLARQSGVSYTTLRRMSQREGVPTAEPVLKIVDIALNGEARGDFLSRYFPEIARAAGTIASEGARQGRSNEELHAYYARDPHCLIILLAQNTGGTSGKTISRLCGEPGNIALAEMVRDGLFTHDEATDQVTLLAGSIQLDLDTVLNCVRTSIARFDRGLLGTEAARVCHLSGGVSLTGLRRIQQIATEAIAEILEIKENPRFFGPIPFFYNTLLNIYDRAAFTKEATVLEDKAHAQ